MKDQSPRTRGSTLATFRAYCPLMIVYAILCLVFVLVTIMGVKLPLDAQTFEGSTASRIVTVAAAVLGLIAGILGYGAAKRRNLGVIKFCGVLSIVMIALYCVTMVLSQAHTNPHLWILLGATSIIPGSFGGSAIRLSAAGLDC